ncbi:hypothetical protein [Leptospira levettii]|uniref:Uncharacterized protein n=1 Tax=Leptospira levettii TaxID=2023178 RepID=A0AAW5VFI6_9LEPT|nr:hypothetical protein [Leptospira levettii]MCW7467630.1 hypothetical protein [Leptospira levettii]MCW7513310.1 hypothetical protein [Leptospira levettii]MCW7517033.1 hypothetical protein [Leptospira levettii]
MKTPVVIYQLTSSGYSLKLYPSKTRYILEVGNKKQKIPIRFNFNLGVLIGFGVPKFLIKRFIENSKGLRRQFESKLPREFINFTRIASIPIFGDYGNEIVRFKYLPASIIIRFFEDEKLRKEIIDFPFLKYLLLHLAEMERLGKKSNFGLRLSDANEKWHNWKAYLSYDGKLSTGLYEFISQNNIDTLREQEWFRLLSLVKFGKIPEKFFKYENPLNVYFLLGFSRFYKNLGLIFYELAENSNPSSYHFEKDYKEYMNRKEKQRYLRLFASGLCISILKNSKIKNYDFLDNLNYKVLQKIQKNFGKLTQKMLIPVFDKKIPVHGFRCIRTLNELIGYGFIYNNCLAKDIVPERTIFLFDGSVMFVKNIPDSKESVLLCLNVKEKTIVCIATLSNTLNLHVARVCFKLWKSGYSTYDCKLMNRFPRFRYLLINVFDNCSKIKSNFKKIEGWKNKLTFG